MPDRYLDEASRDKIFHIIARKYVRVIIVLAIAVSIVAACAIAIPTSVFINHDTNKALTQQSHQNCKNVLALDAELKKIILISIPPHPTKEQEQQIPKFLKLSFQALDSIHCKSK